MTSGLSGQEGRTARTARIGSRRSTVGRATHDSGLSGQGRRGRQEAASSIAGLAIMTRIYPKTGKMARTEAAVWPWPGRPRLRAIRARTGATANRRSAKAPTEHGPGFTVTDGDTAKPPFGGPGEHGPFDGNKGPHDAVLPASRSTRRRKSNDGLGNGFGGDKGFNPPAKDHESQGNGFGKPFDQPSGNGNDGNKSGRQGWGEKSLQPAAEERRRSPRWRFAKPFDQLAGQRQERTGQQAKQEGQGRNPSTGRRRTTAVPAMGSRSRSINRPATTVPAPRTIKVRRRQRRGRKDVRPAEERRRSRESPKLQQVVRSPAQQLEAPDQGSAPKPLLRSTRQRQRPRAATRATRRSRRRAQ